MTEEIATYEIDEVINSEQEARNQSETCQFCDSDDMFVGGLCYTCAQGHYE
jgi:hypothetical protein